MFAGKPKRLHCPAPGPIMGQSVANAELTLATPRSRTVRERLGRQRPRGV